MSEQPTVPDATDARQFDVVLVDQSVDARRAARAEADARLTAELNDGGRIKRFVSGIWKGNIAKDYYRHKYERQALDHIEATQDVLIHETTSVAQRDGAMYATIRRFQSEYDEMVHEDAGERKAELGDTRITDGLKSIVREYADGRLDEAGLTEERARLLQAYRDEHGNELFGDGLVQVDNLLDVARAVKGAVSHGNSLDEIIEGMRIITAESRAGVRTDVEYSRTDQVIEKLGKSKLGLIMGSEATIAAASIAASVVRFGSTRAVGAAAMTIAPGIGAGLLAGLRERKHVKDDRAQHAREVAQGKVFDDNDERRVEMDATRYETVRATDLTQEVRDCLEDGVLETDDALTRALDSLAAIRAREYLSDTRGIDLIAYSDVTLVEQERFDLALARAELKVALRHRLDDDVRQRLSLDEHADIDGLLEQTSGAFVEAYQQDIDAKDEVFKKLRTRRVAKAAAIGAVAGLTFGVAAQEIGASMSSTREGLLEQAWGHESQPHGGLTHETVLQGIVSSGQEAEASGVAPSDVTADETATKFGERTKITHSDNLRFESRDGRLFVSSADGGAVVDVKLREDGSIGDKAMGRLQDAGMNVEDLSRTVMVESTETKTVGIAEFMQNHKADTTRVTRDLWYDNNTPAPTFEANELGLHWGGDNGSGGDAEGNVVMSVAAMQADGSFHGTEATNWAQDARTENLKLAISPSGDTQARPFLIDINRDGSIRLAPDSPAAQFFSSEDGRTVFNGRYAEVVELTGRDAQGVEHVRPLATLVGEDNVQTLRDTVTTEAAELRPRYEITLPPEATSQTAAEPETFVEMAPVIPVVGRKNMEAARSESVTGYYGEYGSPRERSGLLRHLDRFGSPRLRDNPDAKLEMGRELEWYAAQTRSSRGDAYVDSIERTIAASPELSGMSGSIESIVTIPVKASGEEESAGIYDQLRMFASQDADAVEKNMMLLHVNWPIAAESDPNATARIQQTKDEIERARRDFPELKVATVESRWTQRDLEGGVIGRVADTMRDAALLSLRRAVADGRMPSDHDVQIIRNDADAKGIHRNYLQNFQKTLRTDDEADIFTGTTRFDERRAADLPGMVLGQHFAQTINILESARYHKAHTGGANFGVRAATLAAIAPALQQQDFKGVGSDDVMVGVYVGAARNRSSYYGGKGRTGRGGQRAYGSTYGMRVESNGRKVARRVVGAQIDTDSQRSEEAYLDGGYFHNTWDLDFDDGGHRERGAGMNTQSREDRRNELAADIEQQVDILEKDIQYTVKIVGGIANPAVKTSLELLFAGSGEPGYSLSGGAVRLTPEGRTFLTNRMRRDARGRFDPLGSRLSRQLYGQTGTRAKRQRANAPLLSAS